MRVHFTRSLLDVVKGTDDFLSVKGRVANEITPTIESAINDLPKKIQRFFNRHFTTADQTIDYSSEPNIITPDEFEFDMDVESLDRLAREMLIRIVPGEFKIWGKTEKAPISEVWVGGGDNILTREDRTILTEATRGVWRFPVRVMVFVLGEDIDTERRRVKAARIREAGGILHGQVTPNCDYFVTDSPELAEAARARGAKKVIDTLTQLVMLARDL